MLVKGGPGISIVATFSWQKAYDVAVLMAYDHRRGWKFYLVFIIATRGNPHLICNNCTMRQSVEVLGLWNMLDLWHNRRRICTVYHHRNQPVVFLSLSDIGPECIAPKDAVEKQIVVSLVTSEFGWTSTLAEQHRIQWPTQKKLQITKGMWIIKCRSNQPQSIFTRLRSDRITQSAMMLSGWSLNLLCFAL